MSEGAGSQAGVDGMKLWKEWYDTSFDAWSSMLGGDREALMDPFGLYRQLFGGLENTKESLSERGTGGDLSPQDIQRQWMEATADVWRRALGAGTSLAELTPYWVEMAEGLREQMFGRGKPPTDPLDFYQRWYNATNAPLSKMIGDVVADESFLLDSRRFLENYASLEQVFQRASEEYFDYLQLSTHSDTTRIAELVVGLDAKVDRIEEAFEDFEHGYAKPATAEAVEVLEDHVKDLERKLEDNRSGLRRMEGKLDQLLSALNAPATGSGEIEATDAARRKARELGVDLREVQGSGTDGRITVDDVRGRGEAE